MEMIVDKSQELSNVLIVRVTGNTQIKELSGVVSGDHLWLNGVNQCQFIAHVPLGDENKHIRIQSIQGSFVDYLRNQTIQSDKHRISAIFDTTSPSGNDQQLRYCALLY